MKKLYLALLCISYLGSNVYGADTAATNLSSKGFYAAKQKLMERQMQDVPLSARFFRWAPDAIGQIFIHTGANLGTKMVESVLSYTRLYWLVRTKHQLRMERIEQKTLKLKQDLEGTAYAFDLLKKCAALSKDMKFDFAVKPTDTVLKNEIAEVDDIHQLTRRALINRFRENAKSAIKEYPTITTPENNPARTL